MPFKTGRKKAIDTSALATLMSLKNAGDGEPTTVGSSPQAPTEQLAQRKLDARDKRKARREKRKGKPKAKPKAKQKAKQKAKPKAKPKRKPKPKPKKRRLLKKKKLLKRKI